MAAVTLTPQEAYNARKIKMAVSGMKIAVLLPVSAIIQNIFNSSVTDQITASLSDTLIITAIIAITLLGISDLFAGVFTFLYNTFLGKGIGEYVRTLSFKPSWKMLIAGACGGPIATGCWMAATPFCGLTMVAIITSLGPILAAIFSSIFLKERLNPRMFVGIVIVVIGAIIAGYEGMSDFGSNFMLGVGLAFLAPIGFAAESQFSTLTSDVIDPNVGCGIFRCFGSGIIGLTLMAIFSSATGNFDSYLQVFGLVTSNTSMLFFTALVGLFGAVNYNAAYLAFNRTGPSRTLCIDSSRPVWSIILGYLFAAIGVQEYSATMLTVVGAVVVVGGLAMVIGNPADLVNLRKVE